MRVLIVRFSALGDLVLTTGPLTQLNKLKPEIKVDLLTSEFGADIFRNSIELNQCFVVEKGTKLIDLIKIYKNLPNYDIVIDWHGNLKSYFLRFFLKADFFAIKKQSIERRAFVKKRKFKEKLKSHIVEKYYQVLKEAFSLEDQTLEDLRPKLFSSNLVFDKKDFDFSNSITIHPYASQKNKIWPYTDQLIKKLHEKDFYVLIVGQDPKPMEFKKSKKTLNLTNKTNLHETMSIIKQSKALISTDSGTMHLGIALNKPTLALFGPTTKEFGFAPKFKNTKVVEIKGLDCRPCHVHGGHFCPKKHFRCMKDLSMDQVCKALLELL